MQVRDMKQKSVDVHDFAMIPKAEIPRFKLSHGKKPQNNAQLQASWSPSSSRKYFQETAGTARPHW